MTDTTPDAGQPTIRPLPASFWTQLEIQQACRERHFGHLLKSWRELQTPPVKQAELAKIIGVSQGQVSRIEQSEQPPGDLTKLITWAKLLDLPESILWFNFEANDTKSYTADGAPATINDEYCSEDDVHRRELFKTVGIGAALLGTGSLQENLTVENPGHGKIGMDSVEVMREYAQMFRRLDNRFGGGHSLKQLTYYLGSDVREILTNSNCTSRVRQELFSAAAELYQLAGWMLYDTGDPVQGQKALTRALALCQESGNQAYAAELLAGMSHQFSFLRDPDNAIERAVTAKQWASNAGIHALTAEASVMAAHAYAQQGDKRNCLNNLQTADAEFARIRSGETPNWLGYLDNAYMSAKFGHTLKDLGEPKEAERFARQSLQMSDGYDRGRMFNTALLASVLADQGRVDEAVTTGTQALKLASRVRSSRTTKYLSEVAERLQPYRNQAEVRQLFKQMAANRIPLQRV